MNRYTIGLLIGSIVAWYHQELWAGMCDAARDHDVNLIAIAGGPWKRTHTFKQYSNVLYQRVNGKEIDGLVIPATMASPHGDRELLKGFCQRFQPIPTVTIGADVGAPAVMLESYTGMLDLMMHLIKGHGYRRIAFIRGPEGSFDAEERYRAYTDALETFGLPFDPDLVSSGSFHWSTGKTAIKLLVDERRVDFDAVVAANDDMVIGALEALQARRIRVPDDVAIAGFDDSEKVTLSPLTTVAQPIDGMAYKAVDLLLDLLAGKEVPQRTIVPAGLVVRQSCGCLESTLEWTQAEAEQALEPAWIGSLRDVLDIELQRCSEPAVDESGQASPASGADNAFLRTLSGVLRQAAMTGGDLSIWHSVIATLRRHVHSLPERGGLEWPSEELWHRAHLVIGQIARQEQGYKKVQERNQDVEMYRIERALVNSIDEEELVNALIKALDVLDIPSCYLVLYEPEKAQGGVSSSPTTGGNLSSSPRGHGARLALAYDRGKRIIQETGQQELGRDRLLPPDLLSRPERHSLIVQSLRFRDDRFGFAILEAGPRLGGVYHELRSYLSNALRSLRFLVREQEGRAAAEKADQLKTRLLANVSHELRNPLDVILGTADMLQERLGTGCNGTASQVLDEVQSIRHSAEHQRRLVDDLLDLSRAEIDELELEPELVDPRSLLKDVFDDWANSLPSQDRVVWRLQVPDRLPPIEVDPVRLRQVLFNLLSNAQKFTEQGEVILGARVSPPHLHVWVQDTGAGIDPELQDRIFEPFVTAHAASRRWRGIGLGLSVTRQLIALHHGHMTLDSQPAKGSTFHVYLPLPNLSKQASVTSASVQPVLLLISTSQTAERVEPAVEILELSRRQGLEIRRLGVDESVDKVLDGTYPAALAWDLEQANPGDWLLLQRVREHPRLHRVPFILYGRGNGNKGENKVFSSPGLIQAMVKPVGSTTLIEAIESLRPDGVVGPILIVDDEPMARDLYQRVVSKGLPGFPVLAASDGESALELMADHVPSLVILDLAMPGMDGFALLDRMRSVERTCSVPILVLTGCALTMEDIKRIEQHVQVTVQSKGVLSEAETVASLSRALAGDALSACTSSLVKRGLAYFHQHYAQDLSRSELAEAIGVSESYFSRVFHQEMGISPWDYLKRYRIKQAKELLRSTDYRVSDVASEVGFASLSHFSRSFHRIVGLSPRAFRKLSPLP